MAVTDKFLSHRTKRLTAEERAALESAATGTRQVAARATLLRQGDQLSQSTLLVDGLMGRYLDDRQGSRQLIALHVPGDFVDLHAFPLTYLDHDVGALTNVTVASFSHRALREAVDRQPSLWMKLWFSTMLDAAMHRQWVFRLGRLDAFSRLANFMCELYLRLAAVGIASEDGFPLPLTQTDIAEMCGLTHIHVNRVLRQLREERLLEFRGGQVTIYDRKELERRGQFDPAYLYLDTDNPAASD